jgi:phosphopantetheine adenylyltransferase
MKLKNNILKKISKSFQNIILTIQRNIKKNNFKSVKYRMEVKFQKKI